MNSSNSGAQGNPSSTQNAALENKSSNRNANGPCKGAGNNGTAGQVRSEVSTTNTYTMTKKDDRERGMEKKFDHHHTNKNKNSKTTTGSTKHFPKMLCN